MRIVIDKENVSIVFEDNNEKKEFLGSKFFKKLASWVSTKQAKKIVENFDWEKWLKEHPPCWNPITYPIPDHIQDPPIDLTPHIDDPVHPSTTDDPYRYTFTTVTQHTDQCGGCDATPKFNGCDATPRYGKATVDFPSKYPCDVDPEFLKKNEQKRKPRK